MTIWNKLTLIAAGALIGNSVMITNWTHIQRFDVAELAIGIGFLLLALGEKRD